MSTTPSTGTGLNASLNLRIAGLLNPKFGSMPGPKLVARYFAEVLSAVASEDLPVKIYLDHRITVALAPLFKELGVRFRTIPVDRMEPPYILLFIDEDAGRLVVETCDPDLRKHRFVTRLDLFIDELTILLAQARARKKEYRQEETRQETDLLKDMEPKELLGLLKEILEEEEK